MKKMLVILFAMVLALSMLTACGGSTTTDTNKEETEATEAATEAVVEEEAETEEVEAEEETPAEAEAEEEIPLEEEVPVEEEPKAKPKKTVSNKKTAVVPVKKGRTYNGKYEVYQTADGYDPGRADLVFFHSLYSRTVFSLFFHKLIK